MINMNPIIIVDEVEAAAAAAALLNSGSDWTPFNPSMVSSWENMEEDNSFSEEEEEYDGDDELSKGISESESEEQQEEVHEAEEQEENGGELLIQLQFNDGAIGWWDDIDFVIEDVSVCETPPNSPQAARGRRLSF